MADLCRLRLFASRTVQTHRSLDNLRSCCDYISATFVLDDFTDRVDASVVKDVCDQIILAIDEVNAPCAKGEHIAVELIRQ